MDEHELRVKVWQQPDGRYSLSIVSHTWHPFFVRINAHTWNEAWDTVEKLIRVYEKEQTEGVES